jgi:Lar family restriction alleviation protein
MTEPVQNCSAESCDLKPCPFCGGRGHAYQNSTAKALWHVSCDNCDAGPHDAFGEADARRLWNRRVIPTDAQGAGISEKMLGILQQSTCFTDVCTTMPCSCAQELADAAQPPAAPVETPPRAWLEAKAEVDAGWPERCSAGSAEDIARTICLSYGRDPDEMTSILEMCDEDNRPVPVWMVYLEQAAAVLVEYSVSRTPTEPQGAGK